MTGSRKTLDPRLAAAIEVVWHDPAFSASALRDQFLRQVGVDTLKDLIYEGTSVSEVSTLLSPLADSGVIIAPPALSAPLHSALGDPRRHR